MGLKRGAIGSNLGEHIGNLGKGKMKKILPPPLIHPKLQRKKMKAL